eukprot:gene9913-11579_t
MNSPGKNAEKTQGRGPDNRLAHAHGQGHDQRAHGVRQQLAQDDAQRRMPEGAGGFDIARVAHRQHLATDHPRITRCTAQPGGDDQRADAAAENRHEQQRQDQARKRKQHFQQPTHAAVHPRTAQPAQQAENDGDAHGDSGCSQADEQRLAGAMDHPRKNIPPRLIGAEPVGQARRMKRIAGHDGQRVAVIANSGPRRSVRVVR